MTTKALSKTVFHHLLSTFLALCLVLLVAGGATQSGASGAISARRPVAPARQPRQDLPDGRKRAQGLARVGFEKISTDTKNAISEYRLKANGLTVLLVERRSAPVVAVTVVFRVGSRNEAAGYTGATHFLEHMMFKGSARFDPLKGTGIDQVLKPIGGINNATTWFDRTSYFEIVPAKHLDLCLAFEADRMRHLHLRDSDRKAEMTVVRNEFERMENEPGSILNRQLFATAFREHPYHHPVIGWRSDVEGVPTARLRRFYDDFYWPNNATLIIAGDFDASAALTLVARYFGRIPPSPRPWPEVYTEEPPQEGERRFVVQRGEDLPKVMIGYHIPKATARDSYPLAVLESLLGDATRKSSRLYKALLDSGLASSCYASAYQLRDPGLFTLSATANAETKPERLERAILEELERLKSEDVRPAELARAKQSIKKRLVLGAADPLGLSEQLAESIAVADWHWWSQLPANIDKVTAADIKAVAQKYFAVANRTVGYYLPKGSTPTVPAAAAETPSSSNQQPAKGEASPGDESTASAVCQQPGPGGTKIKPASAPAARVTPGTFASRVKRKVLKNGLTVLAMPVPGVGMVGVSGKILSGNYFSLDRPLVAELTADMLTQGSSRYSKHELAEQLENMGTSLEFVADDFWTSFSANVVTEDLPRFLALALDALTAPLFQDVELEKSRKIRQAQIKQDMVDTAQVAWNSLLQNIYKPGSVHYAKPFDKQLEELSQVKVTDLRDFHRHNFSPGNTVIAIVGDIDVDVAFRLAEETFASWPPGTTSQIRAAETEAPLKAQELFRPLADKANVDVVIGRPLPVSLSSPDYYPEIIGNAALGHDPFSSKLSPVRDEYGLCYDIRSRNTDTSFSGAPWVIEFSVNPKNYRKALAITRKIVSEYLKQGISPRELSEEAGRLGGEFLVSLRTPRAVANALTRFELAGVGAKFMDEYPVALRSVSKPRVDEAVKKYFNLDNAVTAAAGPPPDAKHQK